MKIDRQPDGSLVIRANPALLQAILVTASAQRSWPPSRSRSRATTRGCGSGCSARWFRSSARRCSSASASSSTSRSAACAGGGKALFRGLSGELPFDAISDVVLRVRRERDPDSPRSREVPAYRVALVTSAGDLRLSDRMYADEKQQSEIADAIRAALGRPPGGAPVEESIEQLAAAGEVIAAIKLARQRLGLSLTEAKQHVDRLRG